MDYVRGLLEDDEPIPDGTPQAARLSSDVIDVVIVEDVPSDNDEASSKSSDETMVTTLQPALSQEVLI